MKLIIKTAFLAVGLLATTAADAANAIVTTTLNMRTGPGTQYPTLGAIPNGAGVNVRGCTSGYGWCQVGYGGRYGWAASRYLAMREGRVRGGYNDGYNDDFGANAAAIGIPLIAGVIIGSALNDGYGHWDRSYRGWDGHRGRYWNGPRYRPNWNRPGHYGGDHWRPRPRQWGDGPHGQ